MVRETGAAAVLVLALASSAPAQLVTDVPSGDTLVVSGLGSVRLAGIRSTDEARFRWGRGTTPPSQPRHGPDVPPAPAISAGLRLKPRQPARAFLQQRLRGRVVRVEFDALDTDADRRRAYVFLEDGTLVNAELLRHGWAQIDRSRPFDREREFQELEAEARRAGLGIWTSAGAPRH